MIRDVGAITRALALVLAALAVVYFAVSFLVEGIGLKDVRYHGHSEQLVGIFLLFLFAYVEAAADPGSVVIGNDIGKMAVGIVAPAGIIVLSSATESEVSRRLFGVVLERYGVDNWLMWDQLFLFVLAVALVLAVLRGTLIVRARCEGWAESKLPVALYGLASFATISVSYEQVASVPTLPWIAVPIFLIASPLAAWVLVSAASSFGTIAGAASQRYELASGRLEHHQTAVSLMFIPIVAFAAVGTLVALFSFGLFAIVLPVILQAVAAFAFAGPAIVVVLSGTALLIERATRLSAPPPSKEDGKGDSESSRNSRRQRSRRKTLGVSLAALATVTRSSGAKITSSSSEIKWPAIFGSQRKQSGLAEPEVASRPRPSLSSLPKTVSSKTSISSAGSAKNAGFGALVGQCKSGCYAYYCRFLDAFRWLYYRVPEPKERVAWWRAVSLAGTLVIAVWGVALLFSEAGHRPVASFELPTESVVENELAKIEPRRAPPDRLLPAEAAPKRLRTAPGVPSALTFEPSPAPALSREYDEAAYQFSELRLRPDVTAQRPRFSQGRVQSYWWPIEDSELVEVECALDMTLVSVGVANSVGTRAVNKRISRTRGNATDRDVAALLAEACSEEGFTLTRFVAALGEPSANANDISVISNLEAVALVAKSPPEVGGGEAEVLFAVEAALIELGIDPRLFPDLELIRVSEPEPPKKEVLQRSHARLAR